jgi:hypothetical protein
MRTSPLAPLRTQRGEFKFTPPLRQRRGGWGVRFLSLDFLVYMDTIHAVFNPINAILFAGE